MGWGNCHCPAASCCLAFRAGRRPLLSRGEAAATAPVVVSPQERHGAEPPGPEGVELPHAEERAAGHRLRQPLEPAQERWETYVQPGAATASGPCPVCPPAGSPRALHGSCSPPTPRGLAPRGNKAPLCAGCGAGCAGSQTPLARALQPSGERRPLRSPLPCADTGGWLWRQPPHKGGRSGPGPGSGHVGLEEAGSAPSEPSSLLPKHGRGAEGGRLRPCPARPRGVPAPCCPAGGRAGGPLPGGGLVLCGVLPPGCPWRGPAPGTLPAPFSPPSRAELPPPYLPAAGHNRLFH